MYMCESQLNKNSLGNQEEKYRGQGLMCHLHQFPWGKGGLAGEIGIPVQWATTVKRSYRSQVPLWHTYCTGNFDQCMLRSQFPYFTEFDKFSDNCFSKIKRIAVLEPRALAGAQGPWETEMIPQHHKDTGNR